MSRFSVILVIMLNFWLSPLIGMNSWFPWSKNPSKNHYLSEDIKKLMLFRAAESLSGVPKEIKDKIAIDAYKLYCDQLLKNANNIKTFNITVTDKEFMLKYADKFDFMSMNDKGRKTFYILMNKPTWCYVSSTECPSSEEHNDFVRLPMTLKMQLEPQYHIMDVKIPQPQEGSFDDHLNKLGGGKVVLGGTIGGISGILSAKMLFQIIDLNIISWNFYKELFALSIEAPVLGAALGISTVILTMYPVAAGVPVGNFIGEYLTDRSSSERKSIFTQEEQNMIAEEQKKIIAIKNKIEAKIKKQADWQVKRSTKQLLKTIILDSVKLKNQE